MRFPAASSTTSYKGSHLCRRRGCSTCRAGPEVVSVHGDCLEVYLACYGRARAGASAAAASKEEPGGARESTTGAEPARAEAMQRLWIAALWRSPWQKAPFLVLFQEDNAVLPGPDAALYRRLGLPGMARLPPELAVLIRRASHDSPLWRLNAAACLAASLATARGDGAAAVLPASIALLEVDAWERGGPLRRRSVDAGMPETAAEPPGTAAQPAVRLAFDARGLLRIERLPSRPAYDGTMSAGTLAYSVADEASLAGARVHFQVRRPGGSESTHGTITDPFRSAAAASYSPPPTPACTSGTRRRRRRSPPSRSCASTRCTSRRRRTCTWWTCPRP